MPTKSRVLLPLINFTSTFGIIIMLTLYNVHIIVTYRCLLLRNRVELERYAELVFPNVSDDVDDRTERPLCFHGDR